MLKMARTKVKTLREGIQLPVYAKEGDSGFDLVAAEDIYLKPGATKIIPTGLAFEIPPGCEIQVRPRSGVSRKTDLVVMLGTVDSGYRGEVGVIVKNVTQPFLEVVEDEDKKLVISPYAVNQLETVDGVVNTEESYDNGTYLIRKGDRIAQAVIAPVLTANFVQVDELSDSERGTSGYGSTGVK